MMEHAVFGGGCFWCTEAVFTMLRGVHSVVPGYAGGTVDNPTYAQVCSGGTGHAEVIKIEYDPAEVTYRNLLTVFFGSHDPTTLNRQGNDVGTQYRSIIVAQTPEQEVEAKQYIEEINRSHVGGDPVVTEVVSGVPFYEAENYHKNYYERNSTEGYCQVVINPKLAKVQKEFSDLLRDSVQ